jgi:hypothetical protein
MRDLSSVPLHELVLASRHAPWVEQLCRVQKRVAMSQARWKAVTTSRRGGKTVEHVAECAEKLEECARDEVVAYLAKTTDTAMELAWGKFVALNEQYKLGWKFTTGHRPQIVTPKGGLLLVRGAEGSDVEREHQKLRGHKMRHCAIDEAQSIASSLRQLLRKVIEPALGDLRGSCTVSGTPGEVMAGGWYNISHEHEGCEQKWERHRWTIRENTFFKDAEEYLAQVLKDNRWTVEEPTYQREYEGVWIADDSVQVYRYLASRNARAIIPGYELSWSHGLGVDFGQDDACAWTLLTNKPGTLDVIGVLSFKLRGLSPAECADITGWLVDKTTPDVLVGDGGNLGGNVYIQAINERLNERTKQQMVSAQKTEKRAYIELLNGDLRKPLLTFCTGPVAWILADPRAPAALREAALYGCAPLCDEMETLPWANEARLKEHAKHANHCCDSNLYVWRHFSAYLEEAKPITREPLNGEPGYQEWLLEQDAQRYREMQETPWWAR